MKTMVIRGVMAVWTVASAMLVVGACGSSEEPPNGEDCETGSADCECFANSTCNGGLTCLDGTCIDATGSGGSTSGGSGGQTSGGSPGSGATGGSETGGGGTGGGQSCEDTSSDWQNCGECGRICANGGNKCGNGSSPMVSCCEAGQCAPYWGPCFGQEEFSTCDEACTSIGETCVADGCSDGTFGRTSVGWTNGTSANCVTDTFPYTGDNGSCDGQLNWEAGVTLRRCCCTDTQ